MADALPPYPPTSTEALQAFVSFAETQPLTYGPWQQLKSLYKQAEADPNASPNLLGALIARIDTTSLVNYRHAPAVSLTQHGRVKAVALSVDRIAVLTEATYRTPASFFCYRIDPQDPSNLKEMGAMQSPHARTTVLCGTQAVIVTVAENTDLKTVTVLDCSGQAPTVASQWVEDVRGICADDHYLYTAIQSTGFTGIVIRGLSPGSAPTSIGQIAIDNVGAVAVNGDYLYALSDGQSLSLRSLPKPAGLRVIDISKPSSPRLVGSVPVAGGADLAVGAGFAVISRRRSPLLSSGVYVIDVRTPSAPVEAAFLGTVDNVRPWAVVENAAYVTGQHGGLQSIDLRTPAQPRITPGHDALWTSTLRLRGTLAVGGSYEGLHLYNAANPPGLTALGAPPSRKTMGYMKRRTRRFMARLAKSDPDRFTATAFAVLSKQFTSVDSSVQWQTMDLLYGGSDLYRHTRHGRGSYQPANSRFVFRRPIARGHDAWVKHPELAARLLAIPELTSAVHELAYRTILTSGAPMPPIDDALAARFLAGTSALLRSAGVRILSTRLADPLAMSPEMAADLYLAGPRTVHLALRAAVAAAAAKNTEWRKKFADRLFQQSVSRLPGTPLSRRESAALAFVAGELANVVPAQKATGYRSAFLKSSNLDVVDLILIAARSESPAGVMKWLIDVADCTDVVKFRTVAALREAVSGRPFTLQTATSMAQSSTAFIREAGWELLAASSTTDKVLQPLMQSILAQTDGSPALQSMLGSSAALGLLSRAGIEIADVMSTIRRRPALAVYLTAEALTALTRELPVADVVNLIAAATDELWDRLRPGWLRNMREGLIQGSFWPALVAGLGGEHRDNLTSRILADDEFASTFVNADDDSLLDLHSPAIERWLLAWVQRRESRFEKGSSLLLTAATHRLSLIRDWALARVRTQGMDISFALRLLESELPASFDTGRAFFDAASADDITKYALVLCDSPSASVRAYGRFYVRAHWDDIPHSAMIRDLFEGSTPDMQAFTAALLDTEAERPEAGTTFDRDLLRTRSRARRAKELVKKRQESEHSVDIATLTALARGGVKRDADWALAELAHRALAGETVDNVTIEGIAGG